MDKALSTIRGIPDQIDEPVSYYNGVDLPDRVVCRNVVVFQRLTRRTLQQHHLANRMHHRYVLVRVLQTPGVVSVDGQQFQLDVDDALLIAPFQFHHFVDMESDDLRWLFITFELDQGDSVLTDLSYQRMRPNEETYGLWAEVVKLWLSEEAAVKAELLPILDLMLMRLHSGVSLRGGKLGQKRLAPRNAWIAQVESLIIRSIREGWTLGEVARRAGISERQLRARFERQMGLSLRDYRSNYQFHTAISLMRDDSCSLSGVAELSGFNSQSVFTRFIRRMAGRTPRELCRQVREGDYEYE